MAIIGIPIETLSRMESKNVFCFSLLTYQAIPPNPGGGWASAVYCSIALGHPVEEVVGVWTSPPEQVPSKGPFGFRKMKIW